MGYATHGILDCFTAYGTSIFWPFSDVRIALDWIAVVDPWVTVPALALVVLAGYTKDVRSAVTAATWMLWYLGFGFIQHERAADAGLALAHGMPADIHRPSWKSSQRSVACLSGKYCTSIKTTTMWMRCVPVPI